MAGRYKKQSLKDEGIDNHINAGKAAGLWDHDYESFERQRHAYGLTITQMKRNFNLKSWEAMQTWWKVDNLKHKQEGKGM